MSSLIEIIKDGIRSICNKTSAKFAYWVVPAIIAMILWYLNWIIPACTSSDVISGIGLFAGLMFTLLFVITGNYKARKSELNNSKNEEDVKYLQRYFAFAEQSISLISYSIVKAGAIIIISIIYRLFDSETTSNIARIVLSSLLFINWWQFVIILIKILSEMYAMLYDDINK